MTAAPIRSPRILAATAMATAPLVALIIARVAFAGDLPPTIATHWSGFGSQTADGFGDTATYFWVALALAVACAVGAVAAAWLAQTRLGALMWLPLATTISATIAATWIVSVVVTKSAGDPSQAVLGWWILPVVLAAGWGLVLFAVLPGQATADAGAPLPTLARPLRPGERAVWFGQVRSVWAVWLAGALLVGALPAALFSEIWPALILVLTALVVGALAVVSVRLDDTGLSLSSWGLRWKLVPLSKIAGARSETLSPAAWGGWGYRITGRGSALISRGGEGLVLNLEGGRAFAVSVDDSESAARLVNSLLLSRQN